MMSEAAPESTPVMEGRGLRKAFPGVLALANGSLRLFPGQVHALLGENGAGKSTLIKILAGLYQPDEGTLLLDGSPLVLGSPRDAHERGIATIYQELSLVPDLSVAENVFLGDEPGGRLLPDFAQMRRQAREILGELALELDPRTPVRALSVAEQQLVEIARALRRRSRVLIMDEPTAALSRREAERLFALVRRLKADGVAVLYVSHRMEEIFALCEVATVLRDGATVGHEVLAQMDEASLVRMMVGRQMQDLYPKGERPKGPVRLRVRGLARRGHLAEIALEVRGGEIVGLGGLVGAGRTELLRAIFGADSRDAGTVEIDGAPIGDGPSAAVRAGLGLLPEDRKQQGLALIRSIRENATLATLGRFSPFGLVREDKERAAAQAEAQRLGIRMAGLEALVGTLSGGNQQKVLLARWLLCGCKVLLCDEPTRGVDIAARAEIYELLHRLAAEGLAVLLVSSDMPELLGLCDRIVVLSDGRITGELARAQASEEAILSLAMPKGTLHA